MKLFLFDHCPFCVRAMMLTGLKQLEVEWVYLLNHDVQSRLDKIGANQVPILQKPDGSYMAESLDIVAYLDHVDGQPVLLPSTQQAAIQHYLTESAYSSSRLLFPRDVCLGLPEFASDAAVDWFTQRKSAIIGISFDEALANTKTYLEGLYKCWPLLEDIRLPSSLDNRLSYDDVLLFPGLRNLTMVKGIEFSPHIRRYIDEVAQLTGVHLYAEVAL
ncbi:glutaredoxin 2 [Shewanella sp. 4t3-1-2LB]|uniref:glutaredoxin 2 n=1 Tax=Shewanella sp. 4t3-1-2LB TaxID=2817682 RepID=UPI001F60F7C3|nr:glutaredoxin 2 [Shewanella sp. 4t3-1-2LB]